MNVLRATVRSGELAVGAFRTGHEAVVETVRAGVGHALGIDWNSR